MNELTIFEQNGKLLTDSREVALMVEKEHYNLLKDIRQYVTHLADVDFHVSDYFIENEYQDSTGRNLPCYLCTKKGCDMIANKLTGKKGVIFTAKYINAFEKMKDFIEKGIQFSHQISFKEQVECIEVVANILKVNDAGKILMIGDLYKSYNLPVEFLPKYELNGSREMKSATELLKRFDLGMSAKNFNLLMMEKGFLEEKTRASTSKGVERRYKALTGKGLKYGENAVSPQNQREVQPLYYAESFGELFEIVVGQRVA